MPRKRQSYAEILAHGNRNRLTAAQLERRRLEDELSATGGKNPRQRSARATTTIAVEDATALPVQATNNEPALNCAETARVYAENITSGQIASGKLHLQACKRYLNDLEATDDTRGFHYDASAAQKVCDFISATDIGVLLPFQYFVLSAVFGFIRSDLTRRTRTAYVEYAKKSGKSSLAASIGDYMAAPADVGGDGEPRPMIDFCATTRYQSQSIVFKEACRLVTTSPKLSAITKILKSSITFPDSLATIECLASNSDKLNGRNSHCVVGDELGDHPTPSLWNTLTSGQISRRQPLAFGITTAGQQKEGNIAWELHQHAAQVLDGTIEDDSFFALICALDDDDDWQDEKNWAKANPGLGTLIPIDNLRDACNRAKTVPSAKSLFLRFHINRWAEVSEHAWLTTEVLQKPQLLYISEDEKNCTIPERLAQAEQRLFGRPCIIGIDASRSDDLFALAIWFPPLEANGVYECLFRVFCPQEGIVERSRGHRVPYQRWQENGYIIPTSGAVIDEDVVFAEILKLKEKFKIREIGFDIAYMQSLAKRLDAANLKCTKVAQGFALHPAICELEKLLYSDRVCLHAMPLALWCLSNAVLQRGTYQARLDKSKSREKIDLAVAMCDAISINLVRPAVLDKPCYFFI